MSQSAIFRSSDPYEHQRSLRAEQVELVVTARGKFRGKARRIDVHRLWLQRSAHLVRQSGATVETLPLPRHAGHRIAVQAAADDASSGCASKGTAQILEFPSRPHSQTAGDIAALEALAPTLEGRLNVRDLGQR